MPAFEHGVLPNEMNIVSSDEKSDQISLAFMLTTLALGLKAVAETTINDFYL
jgi:hypothetical protein